MAKTWTDKPGEKVLIFANDPIYPDIGKYLYQGKLPQAHSSTLFSSPDLLAITAVFLFPLKAYINTNTLPYFPLTKK